MKKALLIVDVQQQFINKYTKNIPVKIRNFIDDNQFDLVVFSRFVNTPGSNWIKSGWNKMMTAEETQIVPELDKFLNQDNTFTKTAFSVFASDNFRKIIKENHITDLYIVGLDTHACIYATALEAFARGLNVRVISDLCAVSHGSKYHTMALEMIRKNLGPKVLITSAQFRNVLVTS